MKLTCQKKDLIKALNIASKAVSPRTTLPVLKGFLLEAAPSGRLTVSASDQDFSVRTETAAENTEEGAVIVTASRFSDIIRSLPGTEVDISSDNNHKVVIKSMSSVFNIKGLPADEFPLINQTDDSTEFIEFDKKVFREMTDRTSFAASADESRGILTGVKLEFSGNRVSMVATDGYRMSYNERQAPECGEHEIIIPARILNGVSKILADIDSDDEEKGVIYLSEKRAIVRFGNVQAEMKLFDGKYLPYRDMIPKESSTVVTIERNLLISCIERASILSRGSRSNLVKFEIGDTILTVTSDSEEGNVREDLIISKEGPDLTIGFNAAYFLDALRAADDDSVRLEMNSPVNPCKIVPLSGTEYMHMVLPVRL